MKQFLTMAWTLLVAVAMQGQTYWNGTSNKVFSGSGTQTDPYLISTPEQLAGLAERTNVDKEDFAGQYIKLTADIYLTDFNNPDTASWFQWEPIAHHLMRYGEEPDIAYFRGHFDGDGHSIYNMYYGAGMNWGDDWDPSDIDFDVDTYLALLDYSAFYKALFVHVEGGTIENVRMENIKMAGLSQAFLVEEAGIGTVIRNCHARGEMRGTQSGIAGLVNNNKGLIENCSVEMHSDLQGGAAFVGTNEATGVIRNCSSTGSMRCTMSDGAGFVGTNHGLIEQCTADVDIQALLGPSPGVNEYGHHPMWYRSGSGFVNTNMGGTIRECAAFGNVAIEGTSVNYIWSSGAAGFCYRNWQSGLIESCYSTGALRDISDSTGVGGNPSFASFCYDNGYDQIHINDGIERGDIINCYSTSTIRHHDAQNYSRDIHAFVASFHGYGGFDAGLIEQSKLYGCYFNQDGLPAISGQSEAVWNGIGKPLSQMQSQAFVDTLNMLASLMGLSQWELRDGLPRPTGMHQTNTNTIFGGGDGSKTNPFIIATKQHLLNLSWLVNQGITFKDNYFIQTADIALNAPKDQWEEIAPTRWTPIASPRTNPWYSSSVTNEFKGIYNGGFHEIQNMYINNSLEKQGLFYRLAKGAEIRNLGVTDVYIRAREIGIIAGEIIDKPRVIQCWTSGDAATQGQNQGNMGGLIGSMASGAYVLNCGSSAQLTGANSPNLGIWVDAVCGGYPYEGDTLVNFLYTGSMNSGTYCTFRHKENFFGDKEKAHKDDFGDGLGNSPISCAVSTEYMQSKELVNIYNYSVARWNERHAGNDTLLLHYWEWQEGDYPRIAQDPSWRPAVTITFNSNGGAPVTTKYIYPESEALPPQRPLRNGYIFAGWYKDPELTQFFDWKTERPTGNITLYARWHEDKRFEIDVTPFRNEFTKTYHIKTAAQLRGFAALQNGLYSWNDSVPCYDDAHSYAADNLTQTQAPMSFKGKKVVLDNDIVLCDTTDWQYWGRGAFGLPFIPIGWKYGVYNEGDHAFYGTFDGQGHTIYGMYMEKNGTPGWSNNAALFAIVGDSAIIRNVGIAASVIDGQDYNTRGQYKDAVKYWRRCGYSEQGWNDVGMLVGATTGAFIEQCYAEGNIYCTSAHAFIGKIDNYWALHNDSISNCYSRVNVYDRYGESEGSFMSSDWSATIINSYSAGVTKAGMCGCAGSGYGTITHNNTYYNKELAHSKLSCDNSKGCTTNEMHAKATYKNWDFENIWGRNEAINDGYPYLRIFYDNPPQDSPDPVIVTGVTLNTTDTTLITGQTLQMVATILPAEAENKKVTWTSSLWGIGSNNEFATNWFEMDENGFITTHVDPYNYYNGRSGKIRVIATTEEGEYTAECMLTIAQPSITIAPMRCRRHGETEWKLLSSDRIGTENFEYMVLAYTSIDAARTGVTWSVENEDVLAITEMPDTVISIDYVGNKPCSRVLVYAKSSGNATLTATLTNGQSNTLYAEVSRVDLVSPLNYIEIYQSPYTSWQRANTAMGIGETQQLEVYNGYLDRLSYLPSYQWSSSNPNVLTVDQNGLVTAVGVGTATITVAAVGTNVSATTETITVSIIEPNDIIINESDTYIELNEGETFQLTATVLPENASNKTITWRSGNTNYATVDQNGLVTGVSGSTSATGNMVNIFAATSNGIEKKQQFRIKKVLVEPTDITINENTGVPIQLYKGDTYQLTATVQPANASDKTVTWSSDNTHVATVNRNTGLVTARNTGSVTITAKTSNDWDDYIEFVVVERPVEPTYYTVRFLDWNGVILQSSQVLEGEMPTYTGTTPTHPEDEDYTYSFSGWSPTIVAATADADYIAQYTATAKLQPVYYTIQFLNYDGTILQSSQVPEGEMPVYNGTTPTKPEDENFTYEFSGWLPTIVAATANVTYIAQYTATKKAVYYTVTFMDWDGTELLVEQVEEGHDAVGPATNPTREGYNFTGWSKPITNITSNLIVIAQYELIPQPVYYTIRFLNYDGTELQSSQVLEGDMPVYNGTTPTKPEDDNYTYEFNGWSPALVAATADADYTAQYTATPKPQPKNYLPYDLQATVNGTTVTFSWSVQDLPTYFGIGIYYGSQEVFLGTTMNNNTSLTLSSFFEQFGTYTWKLCGANENRQQITEWVDGPSFEIHDPHEGIENTPFPSGESCVEARKILINGQLFILRDDVTIFDARGVRVK